jgi:RNA polymerase sigma-70 factor (ECF subfamily)
LKEDFQAIKEGDLKAFEYVFRLYYQSLCGYATKFLGDTDEAEEITQEIFTTLWTRRETIEIKLSLKSYLYRSVRNACLNYLKHQKVKNVYFAANEAFQKEEELRFSGFGDTSHLSEQIDAAIENLPEERKKIFLMSRHQELKYKEIADQLGISIKTVETQMSKALKSLRVALQEYLPLWMVLVVETIIKMWWE